MEAHITDQSNCDSLVNVHRGVRGRSRAGLWSQGTSKIDKNYVIVMTRYCTNRSNNTKQSGAYRLIKEISLLHILRRSRGSTVGAIAPVDPGSTGSTARNVDPFAPVT